MCPLLAGDWLRLILYTIYIYLYYLFHTYLYISSYFFLFRFFEGAKRAI